MTVSDELHKLTNKAKEAEEKAGTARKQAKADLEKSVNSSRASMQAEAAKLQESAHGNQEKVSTWWDEQQQSWNAHLDKMRHGMKEQKVAAQSEGEGVLGGAG